MKAALDRRPFIPLVILSICLIFLGLSGFVGGYLMLGDPNGAPMGMPVSDLALTPFQNYLVPGLLLIGIWGCGSFVTLIGLWWRPQGGILDPLTAWTHEHWSWNLLLTMGFALIVWLLVQALTLPGVAVIQYILFVLALVMIVLSLAPNMRHYYQI